MTLGASAARPASGSPLYARVVAWLPLAPVLAILAYAGVLAARLPSLVHDTASSDSVGPMVVAQSLPSAAPGSTVHLGNAAHYTTLWFDAATRALPGHRAIWTAMPYVLSLLGLLLLAETVRRLAGWRAALVALAIGIATPPLLLLPSYSQAFHNVSVVNGIVLAALLVWLARTRRIITWRVIAGAELIGVATGLDLASDLLVLFSGVVPFFAAAVLLARRRRDQRASELLAVAASVAVVAVVVALATAAAMHAAGYAVTTVSRRPADPAQIRGNASLLGQLVLDMFNGRLTLHDLGILGPARILLGVIAVAAALVPLWVLERVARGRGAGAGLGGEAESDPSDAAARRHRDAVTLFLAFWGSAAVMLVLVFVFSRVPVDRGAMRYLVSGFMAIAATVPFLTLRSRGSAALVAGAVTLSGVLGAVLLQRASLEDFDVESQHADALIAALEARGLHHGYAGYWQADLLTWQSDGRIVSRSVQQSPAVCGPGRPGWFCPYQFFTVSDWYTPQPGPSFLIRELGGAYVPGAPPAAVRPTAVFSVDRFEVYVYDHDIGADAARNTTGWPVSPSG